MDDGTDVMQQYDLWVDNRYLLLGTDNNGRDIARRLLEAARSTVVPASVAAIIAVGLGVLLGAISGFGGGVAAQFLRSMTAVIQSVPGLLLIALAGRTSDWNLLVMMAAVGLVLLPETASGVQELVERFRRRDFVEAARELGMTDARVLWDEIVWHNGRRFIVSRLSRAFTFAVLTEVTLNFLGLTDPLTPSMGQLMLAGRENDFRATMWGPALGYLLLVIGCFALIERGLLSRWSRR
jgi:peptide/nickel transport system permease protein